MKDTIQLSDTLIVGKGRDRICYEHPSLRDQCIKLSFNRNKQSQREIKYFNFLKKNDADLSKVSKFISNVSTNKGKAFIFELIRDDNGNVSRTLRQCLESKVFALEFIRPQLIELKNYLIANKICVRDISPSNICCKETTIGFNLYIIDGVSSPNLNPLSIRLQYLINSSIDKAWKSLERKLYSIDKSLLAEESL